MVADDELQIVYSGPCRSKYDGRRLFTENGGAVDTARQLEFREAEVMRVDNLDPDTTDVRDMANAATSQLIEHSDGYAKLSFMPRIGAMEMSRH